jgi:hypothetical protein
MYNQRPANTTLGSFNYANPNGTNSDWHSQIKSKIVKEKTRIIEGGVKSPENAIHGQTNQQRVFTFPEGERDPSFDHQLLAQKKRHAECTPQNFYNPQSW